MTLRYAPPVVRAPEAAFPETLEALFGCVADGTTVTIAPNLPDRWDWMEVRELRGEYGVFTVRVRRAGRLFTVALRRRGRAPVWLILAPILPDPVSRAEVDGQTVRPRVTPAGDAWQCAVEFQAGVEHDVVFFATPSGSSPVA